MEKVFFIYYHEKQDSQLYHSEEGFIKEIIRCTEKKIEYTAFTAKRLVSNTEAE